MRLKKGDQIIVTAGKDKGKKGKIERVLPKESKIFVPGINVFKKHLKRRDEKNPGGIVEISKPLSISQVALFCPKCGQATRVGYELPSVGLSGRKKNVREEKIRICKKCQEEI